MKIRNFSSTVLPSQVDDHKFMWHVRERKKLPMLFNISVLSSLLKERFFVYSYLKNATYWFSSLELLNLYYGQ